MSKRDSLIPLAARIAYAAQQWIEMMARYLWRIAQGRPDFEGMQDSREMLLSFGSLYVVAYLALWCGLSDSSIIGALASWLIGVGFLCLAFLRSGRSKTMLFTTMGAGAVCAMVSIALNLLGLIEAAWFFAFNVLEVILDFVCYLQFRGVSEEVRKEGYSPGQAF